MDVNRYKARWRECSVVREQDHVTQASKFIRVILRCGTYYQFASCQFP